MAHTELQDLLRQGAAAARVGERDAAQNAFRQATELAPESEHAWLGLAGAVESLAEKRSCFKRVLAINPDNADAHAGLAWVERKEQQSGQPRVTLAQVETTPIQRAEPVLTAPTGQVGDEPVFCHFHPHVETRLRCNKCGKPICVKCARRTPVGYRCPECIRSQQAVFYTAGWLDYVLVVIVGIVASAIGAAIVGSLGMWLAFFLGPTAGGVIAEAARWAARRRHGRYMAHIVSVCIVIGALPTLPFVGPVGALIFVVTAVGTAFYRLR
jgi:hypothetical protein